MKTKKLILWSIISSIIFSVPYYAYKKMTQKEKALPYKTERPQKRTIKRIIDATGHIRVAEKVKIGSFVPGILKKLYVDENDPVKKGQLLAVIDTGIDDADVRKAQGTLQKVLATRDYLAGYFVQQKALYESGQLSQDNFDAVKRDYLSSEGDVQYTKANLDIAQRALDNTKIVSPQEGIIIDIGIAEGERVTTDLNATVLFQIAKDVKKMEVVLEIDESNIGAIKHGKIVEFTVDSFPQTIFSSTIKEVSYSPKQEAGSLYYKAVANVDNSEELLRPGLSVNAQVFVEQANNVLSIPSQAFMISGKVIEEIAKDLKYGYQAVDKEKFDKMQRESKAPLQTVWVVHKNGVPNAFVEMIVTTNVTDDIFFEITNGLAEDDDVIIELEESDYMEEMLRKAFKSGF